MVISMIPTNEVSKVWLKAGPLLERSIEATASGRLELFDLFAKILQEQARLWIAFDDDDEIVAAMTTEIVTYPRRNALLLSWIGGELGTARHWLGDFLGVMDRYAADCNCQHIEGYGRDGWIRLVEKHGYKSKLRIFEKEVRLNGQGKQQRDTEVRSSADESAEVR